MTTFYINQTITEGEHYIREGTQCFIEKTVSEGGHYIREGITHFLGTVYKYVYTYGDIISIILGITFAAVGVFLLFSAIRDIGGIKI